MAVYSGAPPQDLADAIASASQRYGVPADVLTGIWRVESGSSYPNPYVNSIGYGGLFGTKLWAGSTQAQADLSASILAKLIKQTGSLPAALSKYSGGGYTSVPGQTTDAPATSLGSSPSYSRGTRPDGSGGGLGGSLLGDIGLGGVASAGRGLLEHVPGVVQAEGLFGGISDTVGVVKWLLRPIHWLMIFEILFGSLLLVLGLFFLGQEAAGVEGRDDIGGAKDVAKTIGLGALVPVAGRARAARAGASGRSAKQTARKGKTIAQRPAGEQRRAGFEAQSNRRDRREQKAATRRQGTLAPGDSIPF